MLCDVEFVPTLPLRGCTGRILLVDLDTLTVVDQPVPDDVRARLVGGRGFVLWYLWHAISATTTWNSPENAITLAS